MDRGVTNALRASAIALAALWGTFAVLFTYFAFHNVHEPGVIGLKYLKIITYLIMGLWTFMGISFYNNTDYCTAAKHRVNLVLGIIGMVNNLANLAIHLDYFKTSRSYYLSDKVHPDFVIAATLLLGCFLVTIELVISLWLRTQCLLQNDQVVASSYLPISNWSRVADALIAIAWIAFATIELYSIHWITPALTWSLVAFTLGLNTFSVWRKYYVWGGHYTYNACVYAATWVLASMHSTEHMYGYRLQLAFTVLVVFLATFNRKLHAKPFAYPSSLLTKVENAAFLVLFMLPGLLGPCGTFRCPQVVENSISLHSIYFPLSLLLFLLPLVSFTEHLPERFDVRAFLLALRGIFFVAAFYYDALSPRIDIGWIIANIMWTTWPLSISFVVFHWETPTPWSENKVSQKKF